MSLVNSGFDGTVTERDFSRIMRASGLRDSVATPAAWAVTQGAGRQVSVAPGLAYSAGVVSDSGLAILAPLPTPVNGQWHLVVRRVNWASNTVTVATIPHTTTSTTIPVAAPPSFPVFNDIEGVLLDQHLAWAWVRSTDLAMALFDLRQLANTFSALREVVTFTAPGIFVKAAYPWLRAVRVRMVGGGGGSGGCAATGAAQVAIGGSGGGGGYAERLITNIVGLGGSVTVLVGAGGVAGTSSGGGGDAGTTQFDGTTASGGTGGGFGAAGAPLSGTPGSGGIGGVSGGPVDLGSSGDSAHTGIGLDITRVIRSTPGGSAFAPTRGTSVTGAVGSAGNPGALYGGGAIGPAHGASQAAKAGAAGGDGVIIFELYS